MGLNKHGAVFHRVTLRFATLRFNADLQGRRGGEIATVLCDSVTVSPFISTGPRKRESNQQNQAKRRQR